jgi:hypothetical protein
MLVETKQKPISGGGTATFSTDYKIPFTAFPEPMWQPTSPREYPTVFVVLSPRIANLHTGAAWMSDDFDVPLPEDFLIKDE